jgi:hypothetical protein
MSSGHVIVGGSQRLARATPDAVRLSEGRQQMAAVASSRVMKTGRLRFMVVVPFPDLAHAAD